MIKRLHKAGQVRELLCDGIQRNWEKVDADLIDPLVTLLVNKSGREKITAFNLACILIDEVKNSCEELAALEVGQDAFNSRHAVMETEEERRDNILAYAAELGATSKQLQGDRKAFRRFFGHDSMVARYQSRLGDHQRRLSFLLERLGLTAGEAIRQDDDPVARWRELDIETLTESLLDYPGDSRIPAAAFRGLAGTILGLPLTYRQTVLDPATVQKIHRLALDRERDVWIQSEAISLLYEIASDSFDDVARARLINPPESGDDFFVRHRMVPLVATFKGWPHQLCKDPSPFVRQGVAEELTRIHRADQLSVLHNLALQDIEPSVRATALLEISSLVKQANPPTTELAETVAGSLREEENEYVNRIAIHVAAEAHANLLPDERVNWREIVLPALREVHLASEKLKVRRWASQGREKIWCDSCPELSELRDLAKEAVHSTPPGGSIFVKSRFATTLDDVTLGRVISIVAQDDFCLDIKRSWRGFRIQRGHRFGFRWWRFLHELKDSSPDKRQAFNHTIGRIFTGNLRVPSALMGEMSQTKVPGEPLNLSSEGGWRPFLPLVDEVISSLDENSKRKPLRVVTSEGVTRLRPPRMPHRRVKAHHALNRRFEEFSRLRNSESPSDYVKALRDLGFVCDFAPPEGEEAEPEVAKTFAHSSMPLLALHSSFEWDTIREYFYSAYENSIVQLLLFLALGFTVFLARHVYLNQQFYRSRKKIPLVIGGWGTRGKSGTERIKAAMFNALGHRIVSKTTGCEAMFLYCPAYGKLQELFLFRPYDKATIWEQVNLVNLAAKLKSHLFLWECMGLTPAYIKVIQRQWMKDDISTLVNTYPDHEDLQGPAGINIPEVMTNFLHKGGHCLTSEQEMTPILESAADQIQCRLDKVGWIEPGLIPPDILSRFPYAEHPNNIALVAEMGDRLGIPRDFALKEMADRVVPDLGVLKVYPIADLAGRRLQFVNGFSANERFGTLGNWNRLGFDKQDPATEPGVWITAVVNNRADRVSRSQVFAGIVAEDISVDQLYLIGSNLKGMQGYIREAFDGRTKEVTLFPDDGPSPLEILQQETRRLRLPTSEEELSKALAAMECEEESGKWQNPYVDAYKEYRAIAEQLKQNQDQNRLDRDFRELLWKWFSRKLIVISDFHATGDQIIHRISEETPPGYFNRIMGLQNIKGTGLDFVYRWQAWDSCYEACEKITNRKLKVARAGLVELAAFNDYGLLCEERVNQSIEEATRIHSSNDTGFQTQLELVKTNLDSAVQKIELGKAGQGNKIQKFCGRIRDSILTFLESFLDGGDAVRRRKKADQIYEDLATERISPARAAQEIQKLNKRQKGGWLKRSLKAK